MRMAMRGPAIVAAAVMTFGHVTGGAGKRTLTGTFHWTGGEDKGDLEAVFTPTSEGKWDVAFHFEFDGRPHTYAGTAEGTLAGDLKGRVRSDAGNRTFTFKGTFAGGVFRGTHAEIAGGGQHPTGTLTLRG